MNAKKYKPAVLQNESHPYLHEKDLRDYCRIHNIAFQAYSSLGSADRPWRLTGSITSGAPKTGHEVLSHPDIVKIAAKYGKTTANVVLRWHLQMGGTMCCKVVFTIILILLSSTILLPSPSLPPGLRRTSRSGTSSWTART